MNHTHNPTSLLTQNHHRAYAFSTTEKNSGQDCSPELSKMHGRIFRGFFYACDNMHRVMIDRMGESSDSPRSLISGTATLYGLSPYQLPLIVAVSNLIKETKAMSKQHTQAVSTARAKHLPTICSNQSPTQTKKPVSLLETLLHGLKTLKTITQAPRNIGRMQCNVVKGVTI